jgi:DNA-binding transcriptional LysR family regulator
VGRLLIARAEAILASARDLDRELAATLGLETGSLRVLVGPYVAAVLLGRALGHFLAAAPGVQVEVDEADTSRLAGILGQGEVDVVVAERSLFPDDTDLVVEPLRVRQGEYVCRVGHPLLDRGAVGFDELFRYPLATTQIGVEAWRRLVRGTPLEGRTTVLADSASAVRCQSLTALADLVESSDAIGIFSRGMIRRRLQEGTLAVVPFEGRKPTSDWGIIRRAARTPSPAALAFMEAIRVADRETPVD